MSLLLLLGQTAPLLGNPTGGAVVAGGATIGAAGATLTVNQSTQSAIINWQSFSIANGETTKFIVPNSGATLNRVTGGNPSAIYGTLQSNGTLYLVNPSGIVVGPNGRIDTAGFMASTLDVSNQQFLAGGDLTFAGTSDAAIHNAGTIHASTGDVYLIANQVNNSGTITAPQGNVGLAAGNDVLFQQAGNQHLFVQATPAGTTRATGVTNAGTIRAAAAELKAAGGNAYALAINNTGVIAASGFKKINGQVYLTSDGGSIRNSGKIRAQLANGNGGTIAITGTASSGMASSNTITNSGTLNASATVAGGTGGSISVKNMTGATVHSGAIIAQGGPGGAGGTAEVSGKTVGFTGTVDLTALGGKTGNLLIDPATLDVITGGTGTIVSGQNDSTSTSIDPATVVAALNTADVTLNANNTVTIDNAITWTSINTLTLSTNNTGGSSIDINAPITGTNGTLVIDGATGGSATILTGSAGAINVGSFVMQSGFWNQVGTLPAFTASDFEFQGGSFLRATGGNGTVSTPYQIADVYGLQGVASFVGGQVNNNFVLTNNIDATSTSSWNGGAGFMPIGNISDQFEGSFDGADFAINGLRINLPSSTANIGLFGYASSGLFQRLGLTNANVTGGTNTTGGLIGFLNGGTVENCYITGTVSASSTNGDETGGLLGNMNGVVMNSYSSASVSGGNVVGGLLGAINSGTVTNSYATGSVTGIDELGGLIGSSFGHETDCYSSGLVTGGTAGNSGAFIGLNLSGGGTVTNCVADATINSSRTFVGSNSSGTVANSLFGSTTQLLTQSTYSGLGWSIGTDPTATTWVSFDGATRPMLSMEYSQNINTAHQLQLIGLNANTRSANYTIAQSIDASGSSNASDVWGTSTGSGKGFDPVGNGAGAFSGLLDGQGHSIAFLYINNPSASLVGLFGFANGATISNVGLAVATITGNDYTGALVGESENTSISNSYSSGTVTGGGTGFGTGGLVGFNQGSGTISQSFSTATVVGAVPTGGLVGTNEATISNSFSAGSVSGTLEVGGLVGDNDVGGSIINSYSTSAIGGTATSRGGLIGTNGGGTFATISNSYWDTDTAGVAQGDGTNATQAGITGDTTVQLESSSFAPSGWNFTSVWEHVAGNTPQLLGLPQAPAPTGSPSSDSLSGTAFTNSGVTADGAGITIDALFNGSIIGSTTTNSLGDFTFSLTSVQVTGGVLLTDATDHGNTYYQANSPATTIPGIDIWGSTVRLSADNASNTTVGAAAGNITTAGVQYTVSGTNLTTASGVDLDILRSYNMNGSLFAHDITIAGSVGSSEPSLTTISASLNIIITGTVSKLSNTGINLVSDSGGTGVGTVTFGNGAMISSPQPVTIFYNPSVNPAGSAVNSTSYVSPTENYAPNVTGSGGLTAYMLVNTLNDLQNIKNNLGGNFALSHNIDATPTASWNSGAGFVPLGGAQDYTGIFNGQGFIIDGLTIHSTNNSIGLFGSITSPGVVENVGLTNVNISDTHGEFIGALVGAMDDGGTVHNAYSTGTVSDSGTGFFIGGLIGDNNAGTVSQVYSAATVSAASSIDVGGLAGANTGTLTNAYATGAVTGGTSVGGFVGENTTGVIHNAYSSGLVTGTTNVGGFLGKEDVSGGGVDNSFWDTSSSGQTNGVGSGTVISVVGATTAQLESQTFITANAPNAPTFDFTNVWTTAGGTATPQLIGLPQTALPGSSGDLLSGTAFINSGVTAAGANLTIDVLSSGSLIGSTTTNSSGGFSFTLTNAQLTGGILLTDATDNGNTYYQVGSPASSVTGIDIWGATLRLMGDTATTTALATAKGSLTSGINYTVSGTFLSTTAGVNLNILSNYALNGVTAANDITVNHALTSSTANLSVLIAGRNVTVNDSITNTGGGGITLQAGNLDNGIGTVAFGGGATVSTSGPVTILYNPSVNPAGSAVNTTSYKNPTENFAPNVTGGATLTTYMLVNTLNDLQNVQNNLSGSYALSQNIDATPTATWNSGAGFVPIGFYDGSNSSDSNTFSGMFNGQGHTINGLTSNRPASVSGTGLFGDTATAGLLENLNLTNASITGATYVGVAAGVDNATTSNVITSGTVTGTNYVGGLFGIIAAIVSNSSSAGTVTGNSGGQDVGGLIGFEQSGSVTTTFSTANVSGFASTGGLVGNNRGTIQLSYSTGNVTAQSGFDSVGGLVGYNSAGTISDSYSTSSVTALGSGIYLGGFAGFNALTINDSYAAGPVSGATGADEVGGFVGGNFNTIHNTYSTGLVTANGATDVGGYAGRTTTTIQNSFFDTDSSGQTQSIGNDVNNTDVDAVTTSQLTSQNFITAHALTSPTYDFTSVWTTVGNTLTPQLMGLPHTALPSNFQLDTLDGTAFSDSGGLNFSSGVLINLIFGGSVIGSTTTNGSGAFTFSVSSAALTTGVLLTDATDKGNTYYETTTPASTVRGIDIWGSTVRVAADTATNAALGNVIGSLPLAANGIQYSVASNAITTTAGENFTILGSYTLDGNITAHGVFTTDANSAIGGSANVTLTGSSFAMNGGFNDSGSLSITSTSGQIAFTNVIGAATGLTISSAQAVLMDDAILTLGNGGLTATGTGYTSTVDANGEANGINLFDTSITSSGAVSLTGTAGYTTNGNAGLSAGLGVFLGTDGNAASLLSTTGSANLSITGTFNSNITSSSLLAGVFITNDVGSASNTVSVADGRLIITGAVDQGTTTSDSRGVVIENGPTVEATGAGLVTVTGTESAVSAATRIGVAVDGSLVSTVNGALNLSGTVTRGTAQNSIGVGLINGADVAATGTGSATVTGNTTGSSATFNAGVYVDDALLASSGASGLAVNGNAGAVTGANPVTVNGTLYNPFSAGLFLTLGSSLSTTNTGSVRLTGVAGPNDSTASINAYGGDTGVRFQPSGGAPVTVTSAGGGIAITGTSGAGAGTFFNVGVNVSNAVIQDTGDGAVNVTGFGGVGQADNSGVAIEGSTTKIQAGTSGGSSGVLTIIGHGATGVAGSQNDGISIFNTAQLVSGGGGIVITGDTGTPGSGSSGVLISTASVTTPNGPLAINSTGGGLSIDANTTALTTAYSAPAGVSATLSNLNGATALSGGNFFITQSGNLVLDTTTVQSLSLDVTGSITQIGRVAAGLLSISNAGSVTLTDGANVIEALGGISSSGAIALFTDPGLVLTGAVTSPSAITIAETGGPLTIASTGSVVETGTANVILAAGTNLANSNYFVNEATAGANAVQTGSFGRFYLFSSDPAYNSLGGITFAPTNLVYQAVFPTSASSFGGSGNAAFFYVGGSGQVGPNSPVTNVPPNTTTGGAAGGGSNLVPPALTPQPVQVSQQDSNTVTGGTNGSGDNSSPPPFSFTGTGVSQLEGQLDGGLANSASNSGQVGSGDLAQLGNGQYGNVSNPQAADALNQALGPMVYSNLADALKTLGDWAEVPDSAKDPAAGDSGETILTGGDVAEMTGTTSKKIPLSEAPEQLQNAMKDDSLKGASH